MGEEPKSGIFLTLRVQYCRILPSKLVIRVVDGVEVAPEPGLAYYIERHPLGHRANLNHAAGLLGRR